MGMQFFAYSRHIDELDDPKHVAQRLYSLQLILNGALRISWGNANTVPVSFIEFFSYNSGARHSVYASTIEECPFNLNSAADVNLPDWNNPKNRFPSYLVNLSKTDADLRGILFLVGLISSNSPVENILTWGTLYKILDSVKCYSKIYNFKIENYADISRINEFTAACNNMSILGLYARHGATENKPPKKVMTDLSEATNLIISLASKFCRAYVTAKYS